MPNIDDFTDDIRSTDAVVRAFYVGSLPDLETMDEDADTLPGVPPSFEDGQDDLPLPFVEVEVIEILDNRF